MQAGIEINDYLLILLIVCVFALFWFSSDMKQEHRAQVENQELMAQIRSTEKDANMRKKQLLTIVTSLPFPMLLLDTFGKISLYNTHLSIFGPLDNIDEMTYLNNKFHTKVQEFLKDAYILEKEMDEIKRIDHRDYQALAIPIRSKQRFSGCLVIFQDITKTLAGEKMQKRFIADASHELKTPIAIIKGMVEILNREDFNDEATQHDFMNQISNEIERLDLIVKDMLQLSRLSIDDPILDRRKCDIVSLIDQSLQPLKKMAKQQGLEIITNYNWRGQVFLDPMKMNQVLSNLISNSIKYSDHGEIRIQVDGDDKYVTIQVHDQGKGLDEVQQKRIFERFYRVDDDRARKSGGSGLGLAIVKSIVEAHGGKISVSSAPNQGTTFYIQLRN